jgi:hypothetical protein
MPQLIAEGFEMFEAIFSSENDAERELVAARIAEAVRVDGAGVTALKSFYATDDRGNRLFEEMRSLDRQWVDLYGFFGPLEIVDCLDDAPQCLSGKYTLSEKPLARLKAFHSDCFETVGRLLVIAACYEGIATGRGMGVPSRKRLIPPDEFEHVANGAKPDLIAKMPFWRMLDGIFDSKLRNGIGHHSWKYDPASDMISYQNHSPARGREDFTIAYLDFCIHTRKLYHCATFASGYLHSVWL